MMKLSSIPLNKHQRGVVNKVRELYPAANEKKVKILVKRAADFGDEGSFGPRLDCLIVTRVEMDPDFYGITRPLTSATRDNLSSAGSGARVSQAIRGAATAAANPLSALCKKRRPGTSDTQKAKSESGKRNSSSKVKRTSAHGGNPDPANPVARANPENVDVEDEDDIKDAKDYIKDVENHPSNILDDRKQPAAADNRKPAAAASNVSAPGLAQDDAANDVFFDVEDRFDYDGDGQQPEGSTSTVADLEGTIAMLSLRDNQVSAIKSTVTHREGPSVAESDLNEAGESADDRNRANGIRGAIAQGKQYHNPDDYQALGIPPNPAACLAYVRDYFLGMGVTFVYNQAGEFFVYKCPNCENHSFKIPKSGRTHPGVCVQNLRHHLQRCNSSCKHCGVKVKDLKSEYLVSIYQQYLNTLQRGEKMLGFDEYINILSSKRYRAGNRNLYVLASGDALLSRHQESCESWYDYFDIAQKYIIRYNTDEGFYKGSDRLHAVILKKYENLSAADVAKVAKRFCNWCNHHYVVAGGKFGKTRKETEFGHRSDKIKALHELARELEESAKESGKGVWGFRR